jgi:hypothetical protein
MLRLPSHVLCTNIYGRLIADRLFSINVFSNQPPARKEKMLCPLPRPILP